MNTRMKSAIGFELTAAVVAADGPNGSPLVVTEPTVEVRLALASRRETASAVQASGAAAGPPPVASHDNRLCAADTEPGIETTLTTEEAAAGLAATPTEGATS